MFKRLFGPRPPLDVTIQPSGVGFKADPRRTLLESALAAGIGLPYDCKVGTCGSCRFRLDEGRITELSPSAVALTRELIECGWRLACQAIPRSPLSIHVEKLMQAPERASAGFRGAISSVRGLTHDIAEVTVELTAPIAFVPGQFAELSVEGVKGARSYSFAAWPATGSTREPSFHIRKVPGGAFTQWLFEKPRVGAALDVRGPLGRFGLRQSDSPLLFVAGGSGLAPVKCILEHALATGTTRPATLLFGARTQADLFCLDDIEDIASRWQSNFRFVPVLSLEPEGSSWNGARGLVMAAIRSLDLDTSSEAYLCGPPAMVDAAELALVQAGLSRQLIFADRFFDRRPVDAAGITSVIP